MTQTDVHASTVAGSGQARVEATVATQEGVTSAVLVGDAGVGGVQGCALAQVVHITDGELVARSAGSAVFGSSVGHGDVTSAHGDLCTDLVGGGLDVGGAVGEAGVDGHQFGHAQVIGTSDVGVLVLGGSGHHGVASGHSDVQGASSVAHANTLVLVGLGSSGRELLAEGVRHLSVHTLRTQSVATTVGGNVVQVAHAVAGAGSGSGVAARRSQRDVGTSARTQGAERIEHGVAPEGRGVVTAQADGAEAASQIQSGAAVEHQATVAGASANVVVQLGFEPEGSGHAATQVFGAAEAQLARGQTGSGQLGLGHAVLLGGLNASVNDAPDGHGRLSERSGGSQGSQSKQ